MLWAATVCPCKITTFMRLPEVLKGGSFVQQILIYNPKTMKKVLFGIMACTLLLVSCKKDKNKGSDNGTDPITTVLGFLR